MFSTRETSVATTSSSNLALVIVAIVIVVSTVIAGIVCRFVLGEEASKITLLCLIAFLIVFGIAVMVVLLVFRKRTVRYKQKQIITSENTRYTEAPTAPDESGPPSYRNSNSWRAFYLLKHLLRSIFNVFLYWQNKCSFMIR